MMLIGEIILLNMQFEWMLILYFLIFGYFNLIFSLILIICLETTEYTTEHVGIIYQVSK